MGLFNTGTSILVIEDDPVDAELLVGVLQRLDIGDPVELVTDLTSALAYLSENSPQLVLVDLNLPDSKGLDSVRSVVKAAPQIPVIALTGLHDQTLALDAVRCGAQDYVPKDLLDTPLLERVLSHALDRQSIRNALSQQYAAWTHVVRSLRAIDKDEEYLRVRNAAAFAGAVGVYETLLSTIDGEPTDHRGSRGTGVEELARRLASVGATVTDLLDVHLAALGRRRDRASQAGNPREREQLLILEAMGHLVGRYREQARASRSKKAPIAM